MKKLLTSFLLLSTISLTHAGEIPVPHCVNGKWEMNAGPLWSIAQSTACINDSDIQPYRIRSIYTHVRSTCIYNLKTIFFDKKGQEAVVTLGQKFGPWGLKWTGGRRHTLAYCPSETGSVSLKECPILQRC